jgi:hypothetical protein
MKIPFLTLLYLVQINSVFAAVYDTLPAGVNTIVAKQVSTTKIESRYGANSQSTGLALKQEFKSSNLETISDVINSYFKELQALSPIAYNQFSLGEFKANAWAEINAQGIGFGHGITDHLTILASVPFYHVKTNVSFSQTKKSNLSAMRTALASAPANSAAANFVRELTMQMPETNEQLLQSLIVNYYGYKPLGYFERDTFGDAEVGMIYRFTDFQDKGQSLGFGAVLPTGKMDDPNSLQDVSTGDGQYDAYLESLSGISFLDNNLQLDLKARYTYQFAARKNLRMIGDPNFPLTRDSRLVNEKLGNKVDTTFQLTVNPTIWLNVHTAYIANYVGGTTYEIPEQNLKSSMEANTTSFTQWGRIGLGFSGVELYKRKKVDIPFEFNLSYQRIINGKNTADYERIDADFRLYF